MLIAKTCFRAFVRDNFGTFCTCQNIEAEIYELKEIWKFKEKTKWQKRQTHGNSSFGMWQYWEWVGAGKRDSIGNRLELGKRDSLTPTNNKNGITKKLSDVNKKSNIQNSRPTYKNKGKHCIVLYSFFILGKKQ